jgi:hypothetical protein
MAALLLEQFYFRADGDPVREAPAMLVSLVNEVGRLHVIAVGGAVAWFLDGGPQREAAKKVEHAWEKLFNGTHAERRPGCMFKLPRPDRPA